MSYKVTKPGTVCHILACYILHCCLLGTQFVKLALQLRSSFRKGLCSGLCYLPSTAAWWVTSSQIMVFTTTSTPMTCSSTSPWVSTTQLQDCLLLLCVLPTSNSSTYRMACSSTQTSRRLYLSALVISCVIDSSASSVSIAGVEYPSPVWSIHRRCWSSSGSEHEGVGYRPRLAPDVSQMVAQSCDYHVQAIRHIR